MYGSIHNIFPILFFIYSMRNQVMNMNHCVEMKDTGDRELNNQLTETGKQHQNCGFFIPAGVLVGLGIGLLVGQAGVGFLLGLGSGFLGTGLFPLIRKLRESKDTQPGTMDITNLFIGAFLVAIGVSTVMAPVAIWPYEIAGLLILIGIWILVKGFFTAG